MSTNLVKGCRLWDRITEKMNRGEYPIPEALDRYDGTAYSDVDYNALKCRIVGKTAEVVVGDAPEHRTKIDLRKKALYYYDPDDQTNASVANLLRSIGLLCRVNEQRGVFCSGMTSKKAVMVFKALGMIPSMDRRLEYCHREGHGGAECREMELKFFKSGAKKEK